MEADFDACARVFAAARAAAFPDEPPDTRDATAFRESCRDEEITVAEFDGEVIALISIYWTSNFIHSLYVDPAFQGRGAGRALLAAAQARAAFLELKVGAENHAALGFYHHLGWRQTETGEGVRGPWFRLRWERPGGAPPATS